MLACSGVLSLARSNNCVQNSCAAHTVPSLPPSPLPPVYFPRWHLQSVSATAQTMISNPNRLKFYQIEISRIRLIQPRYALTCSGFGLIGHNPDSDLGVDHSQIGNQFAEVVMVARLKLIFNDNKPRVRLRFNLPKRSTLNRSVGLLLTFDD